jgi:lambda family phage portal protein
MPANTSLLNPIDRLVSWFNPRAGLQRMGARHALQSIQAQTAHEAAKPSRYRQFYQDGMGPNAIVQQGAVALRAQARHLERNNDIARGILRTMVNNVVGANGIGIEPQPRRADGSIHEDYAAGLRELWRDWCLLPEVTQTMHFAKVQRALCRAWLRDGEAFGQHLTGFIQYLDHGTRVPYSLELFEADMVPMWYQDNASVYQGIERNTWGRATGYYVYKTNPMDAQGQGIAPGLSSQDLKRIDAARVLHLVMTDRIGQVRGISEFASIIGTLEDIKDYEQSERIAAKISASLTAYVKKNSPDGYTAADAAKDAAGNVVGRDMRLSPGMIIDNLQVGEEIGLIDSTRPNPNVVTFRQGQLRRVAAGIGASYSSIAKSYDGTYSAQRQELVEQWINYAVLAEEFTGQVIQPIWTNFVNAAHLSGVLRTPKDVRPGSANDAMYLAQSMPWIDPLKEAEAWTALVKAGFASEIEVMRKRGVNPQDLLDQTSYWRNLAKEKGLVFDSNAANDIAKNARVASDQQALQQTA